MGLQETILNSTNSYNRADLDKSAFDRLITEKGRTVLLETALMCPCKGETVNSLSTCRNCGSTGYVFINPRETRMVLQGFDVATKFEGWSEELRGMMSVSCLAEEKVTYMDKITALDANATHNQILFFKDFNSNLFAYAAYPIKKVIYAGLFVADDEPLTKLTVGTDFTVNGNVIVLSNVYANSSKAITFRYEYAPTFHIVEMKRETMQSFKLVNGVEVNQHLPLSAYARRAHYVLNASNIAGDRLLDNTYETTCDPVGVECAIQTKGNLFDFRVTQGDLFEYSLDIKEDGIAVDISSRVYKLQVRDINSVLITEFTIANGGITIIPLNTISLYKSTIQTAALIEGVYHYDLQETNGADVETILSGKFIVAKQITV